MPRPAEGYRLLDGTQVPGVTDITKRFGDKTALIAWARNQGFEQCKAGLPKPNHFERSALDEGTVVHGMIELYLRGRGSEQIEVYGRSLVKDNAASWEKVRNAFAAFTRWAQSFHVGISELELSLVSEKHRYGGTIDKVGVVGRRLAILDFKVRAKPVPYAEDLVQLAAYGQLYAERFPDRPLEGGYFLICLPKDGSACVPFHYPQLEAAGRAFAAYRYAYDLDRTIAAPDFLAGQAVAPPAPAPARDVINLAEAISAPPEAKPSVPNVPARKPRKRALVMNFPYQLSTTVRFEPAPVAPAAPPKPVADGGIPAFLKRAGDGWDSFKKASA